MKRFIANCKYFEIKNPRACALFSLTNSAALQFCKTELGELNLVAADHYYHSQSGAQSEASAYAKEFLASIKEKTEIICIYGIGLGYSYQAFRQWLLENKEHTLIFLEDDLATLMRFLETEMATELLKDPQVHLYHIEETSHGEGSKGDVFQEIAWSTFPQKMAVGVLPYYEKIKKQTFQGVKNRLLFEESDTHCILDEYTIYGVPYFRNFWPNLLVLPDSQKASALFGAFKDVPAIVVGAGPSLNKQIDRLRELKDRALIFAGGSAINALTDNGITPHFAASIDPNPMQYLRLRQNMAFETPFFFRHRAFNEALGLVSGPKLYLPGGDGYNISDWFEKRFKIKGKTLGGGHSIANFIIEIAYALGCRPIILVGYDLAYTNRQSYAQGVEDEKKRIFSDEDAVDFSDFEGNPILTAWKWILEGRWISEFASKHPKLRLLNATEGGIPIEGVKNVSFSDVAGRYLTKSYDLDGWVHTEIQKVPKVGCTPSDIFKQLGKMFASVERCLELLEALIAECTKHSATLSPLDDPQAILMLEKLHQEIAFKYILDVFDRMRTKLDYYKKQFRAHLTFSEKKQQQYEKKLLLDHLILLREVAKVNYILIQRMGSKIAEKGKA